MTAKEELKEIRKIDNLISQMIETASKLRSNVESITPQLWKDKVRTVPAGGGFILEKNEVSGECGKTM